MNLLNNPFSNAPAPQPGENARLITMMVVMLGLFFAMDLFMPKTPAPTTTAAHNGLMPMVAAAPAPRADVLAQSGARIVLENDLLAASISPRGAMIDDLTLKTYKAHIKDGDPVTVLSPSGSVDAQYVSFGWLSPDPALVVPGDKTVWTVAARTPQSTQLSWKNPQGITFDMTITLDAQAMFTIDRRITNGTGAAITLYPYARVVREGIPSDMVKAAILHEGPIAYIGGKLHQTPYKKMDEAGIVDMPGAGGWVGITSKYWLTALITDGGTARFARGVGPFNTPLYQADVKGTAITIPAGGSADVMQKSFVGPKKVKMLESYEKSNNIPHFDLAVDFGMFYFLTRPFFELLNILEHLTGSFAIALLLMSVCLRTLTFPLANTTYRSFAKLRKLSPEFEKLKEKYGTDKQKMQMELFALYQREKVNPAAGCFPILIQIPIFYALYKVLFVTIEMRHAPFFGWITDMSAPDPTSLFTLFGLIPWDPPSMLMIGAWPCIYCLTMYATQSLSPNANMQPEQKTMMMIMPAIFTVMLAHFPAGLVIYWSWSNLLSMVQQTVIMKSMGVDVFKKPA